MPSDYERGITALADISRSPGARAHRYRNELMEALGGQDDARILSMAVQIESYLKSLASQSVNDDTDDD